MSGNVDPDQMPHYVLKDESKTKTLQGVDIF